MLFRATAYGLLLTALPAAAFAQSGDIALYCKDRKPCAIAETKPAGTDAQGRALTVVELNLGEDNDGTFNCKPFRREFWIRTEGVAEPKLIMELCNDGYGASQVGDDDVAIKDNRLDHMQYGGSAWRWSVTRNIRLSPLNVLDEAHCSYHNTSAGFSTLRWDWQRFAGEARWTPKQCTPTPGKAEEDAEIGCESDKATRRYIPVPQLEGAFERTGKRLHLGSCATAIDESGERGFVLFGTPRANGAELRALMLSPRDLVVTVSDAQFATGAANWLNDDHIELWLGHGRTALECENERPSNLRQWGIGLDGKVYAAFGNPRTVPRVIARLARMIGGRAQVTLHILLPEDAPGITLAFSKSAGGKQARLVATSPFNRADVTTIGGTWRVEPKAVRCAEKDGQLDLIETGLPALIGER